MKPGFEDAFMDAQSNVIALTLELLQNSNLTADKLYVYMYQDGCMFFGHAFFVKNKKLYMLNDWFDDAAIDAYFDCQYEDIESIVDVCKTYEAPCPYEFKLVYNISTGSFDSSYEYTDIASERDTDVVELYKKWQNEIGEELK